MATQGTTAAKAGRCWDSRQLQTALAAAHHHAQRGGLRLQLSQPDRDDLRQDILVALLLRCRHFDPDKGAWSTFVAVIARHAVADRVHAELHGQSPAFVPLDVDAFSSGCSATQQDAGDLCKAIDMERAAEALPPEPRALLELIRQAGDVGDAQRASAQSCASFYRAITDLRFWLTATGLRPPHGIARARRAAVA